MVPDPFLLDPPPLTLEFGNIEWVSDNMGFWTWLGFLIKYKLEPACHERGYKCVGELTGMQPVPDAFRQLPPGWFGWYFALGGIPDGS